MQPSGTPRAEVEILDLSILVNTGLKGVIGVHGITEWGPVDTPTLVGSWPEYQRKFGGLLTTSDFPHICKRALEAGGRLKIARAGHYTTITNAASLVGVKATITVGEDDATVTFTAKSVGAWGNKVLINVVAAANLDEDSLDIVINIAGYPQFQYTYRNFPITATPAAIADFNAKQNWVNISFGTDVTLAIANFQLATGAQDVTAIVTADYTGDEGAQTGFRCFDNSTDIVKISVPEKCVSAIDVALSAYADSRGDLLSIHRTPVGLDADGMVDYRNASGAYSAGTALNTWRSIMTTGGLRVTHPTTGLEVQITELGDVLGAMSRKDNVSLEWFTFGGPKRGLIKNVLGVVYNVGTAARRLQADNLDIMGLNPVIDDDTFGTVIWGNNTLQKDNTLLKHANVAELMIFLTRQLSPIIRKELFDPNDITTWKTIYRNVKPLLDYVKDNRGIWNYLYQGDQDIDDVSQAVVNSPENIDAGQYLFNLFVQPKVGLKYAGVRVIVTNSGVSFEELSTTPQLT